VELPEDSARYGEKAVRESGALKVEHTLAFLLDPVGGAAANFISSLEEWSRHSGMVAIVELLSGERLLVGFSRRFLARMPLRLSAVEGSTGGKPSERSALTVTLRSTDTAPALPLL
jgi:hypothetical protein